MGRQDTESSKRASNLTSAAFSFSLDSPKVKRARTAAVAQSPVPISWIDKSLQRPSERSLQTPRKPSLGGSNRDGGKVLVSHISASDFKTPALNKTSGPSNCPQAPETPTYMDREFTDRKMRSSSSKFRPISLHTPNCAQNDLTSLKKTKALVRLTNAYGQTTPKREEASESERKMVALRDTRLSDKVAEKLMLNMRTEIASEDGEIGVSPQGKKIIKWNGRGSLPLSLQLSNLLSSSKTSLLLFYTSMQHALYPSNQGLDRHGHDAGPRTSNLLNHITQAASIRLRLLSPVKGPTHQPLMFWCQSLKWSYDEPTQKDGQGETVLVALQLALGDCPRLGIDPNVIRVKMENGQNRNSRWILGVWAWNEVSLPLWNPHGEPEAPAASSCCATESNIQTLLVTRYLIAEDINHQG
ncbi:uncharacterized protein L203_102429 [Cryptococcus depauperatus CBS 7841]|uniref:Uncharacterized protein n=1 Tax=Cryptococcus depauperatus CBS 7841 TaxID=1295531 RepID=A0A1E3IAZ6_9TREE|nr:hypothetical protein L203_04888 [Cryptococcus depauperatus CBS 7841]